LLGSRSWPAGLQNVQFWEASVPAGLRPTSAQIGGSSRVHPQKAPNTLCDRWRRYGPRSARAANWRASGGNPAALSLDPLLGGDSEGLGMGPAVMLSQDLADVAGPVGEGAVADLAAGDRHLGNGHREAAGT
jgi:hypothetical protein